MLDDLRRKCCQVLRHVAEILPPGALYSSGAALGLGQNCHLLIVIVPIWIVSATITALTSRAALQAAKFGRISGILAFLSILHSLLNHSKNANLTDEAIRWLCHYIIATSMAAAVVAVAFREPSGLDQRLEPLIVERQDPQAREAKALENLPDVGLKPTLEILPFLAGRKPLSDIGSVAFRYMGPNSSYTIDSSDDTGVSLPSVGKVEPSFAQDIVLLYSIANPAKPSLGDDDSVQLLPDIQ